MTELRTFQELLGLEDAALAEAFALGGSLLRERRWADADEVYRGLVVLCPERVDAWRGHALALLGRKRHDDAADAIDRALSLVAAASGVLDGERASLFALRALVERSRGDKPAAQRAAAAALRDAGNEGDAAWRLELDKLARELAPHAQPRAVDPAVGALVASRLVDVLAGKASLAWALGVGDLELRRLFDAGTALLGAGHVLRARKVFEGLVALKPTVPAFWLALADAADLDGDIRAVRAALDGAAVAAAGVTDGADLVALVRDRRAKLEGR